MCRHFNFPFMLQLTGQCAKHLTQISLVLINVQNDPTHPLLCTRNLLPAQTDPSTPQDCGQNCIKGRPSLGGWAAVWRASCKRGGGTVTRWMTRRWGSGASSCNPCCHGVGSPLCGKQRHVSKVVTEKDYVHPEGGATPAVRWCVLVHFPSQFAPGWKERVHSSGPGGFTKGWWEMFVVQHWNPVHPAHLKPLPVTLQLQSEEEKENLC